MENKLRATLFLPIDKSIINLMTKHEKQATMEQDIIQKPNAAMLILITSQ